jgi:hypothetical protein
MRIAYSTSLPPEILELIFDRTEESSLPFVLLANSALYTIGSRSLYRTLTNRHTTRQRILLLQSLANSSTLHESRRLPNPAQSVRLLHLDFSSTTGITSNLLHLIQRALHAASNLRELLLEFASLDNYKRTAWCLQGTSFKATKVYTSVGLDSDFFDWISDSNQDSIQELSLRGHHLYHAPSISALLLSSKFAQAASGPKLCLPTLPPHALPNLRSFRSVHLSESYVAVFLTARPVESVALTLFPFSRLAGLDALALTSTPVRRLTVLCLDDSAADVLVEEVAKRLGPELESLHIVILSVPYGEVCFCLLDYPRLGLTPLRPGYPKAKLQALAPSLSVFANLRYITFMAPDPPNSVPPVEAGARDDNTDNDAADPVLALHTELEQEQVRTEKERTVVRFLPAPMCVCTC